MVWSFFFFFFQAEDGIRDGRVTGVQTCALPISVRLGRRAEAERRGERGRVAFEVAVHGRYAEARGHERHAGIEGEPVTAPLRRRHARDLAHERSGHALGGDVRADLIGPVRVRLAPALEEVRRLPEADLLALLALHPGELLESLHDVMGVAQAYRRRVRQLLEPPRPRRLDEEHADDAGRARSEERAEGTHGGADVALAFLLDQDVPKGEVAVAREVDIAEVVARENPGALRPDVDGGGDRIRLRQIASDLGEPGHDRPDLSGLPQWADLNDQRVLLVDQPELRD